MALARPLGQGQGTVRLESIGVVGEPAEPIPVQIERIQSGIPRIIAAIPCYNEGPFIGDIVRQAKRYVHQVIVIDDGSSDDTAEAARAAGAYVVKHKVNKGYGAAIGSCFKAARDNHADIVVTFDGDRQHLASDIPAVIEPILRGEADLTIGSRFMTKDQRKGMPQYRRWGNGFITWLFNVGSRTKVSDSQSGFRGYSKRVVRSLPVSQKGMAVSVEILAKARKERLRIREVPITCLYHSGCSSLNPLTHGMGVALRTLLYRSVL